MLRYRFGFPGIFFLFNVWWDNKLTIDKMENTKYFEVEIRFTNFRYWSYYLTRTQGKPVENWGGKFLWSEVALFDVWVFLSDPLFDIPSSFDQTCYSIPEFFLITPVIWLWTLVPCHPWPDNLFISPSFNPDSSCFRKMCCQFANPSSHAWY